MPFICSQKIKKIARHYLLYFTQFVKYFKLVCLQTSKILFLIFIKYNNAIKAIFLFKIIQTDLQKTNNISDLVQL